MEKMRKSKIPAFGDWNYSNDSPMTQYFESIHGHYGFEEEHGYDLFYAYSPISTPGFNIHNQNKVKKNEEEKMKKQGRVRNVAVNPVDEDLYKIPPDLLFPKSKKKKLMKGLWAGFLRLSCIA
ncbi:hypothetical protein LUZ60_008018 [Juncus effusus]|nr:hypothetical protein LUZ60_008018 [Juncus effusus]